MFDGLPPDSHGVRRPIEALLHRVDDGLMLPALDTAFFACRAPALDRAVRASAGPVVTQGQPMLDVGEPPSQPLSGRAAVFVFSSTVDKILFAKPPFRLRA